MDKLLTLFLRYWKEVHNFALMRVIYNRFIPFRGFYAINLFGLVFARREQGRMSALEANHEYIHTLQQRELLFVFFYVLYLLEWLFLLIQYRSSRKAYFMISFELEAYRHQEDLEYRKHRRHFAWAKEKKTH